MPELPEVETVRRGLNELLSGEPVIESVEVRTSRLRTAVPIRRMRALRGLAITGVERRAKFLLFYTPKWVLLNHLGMTGTWRLLTSREENDRHDHLYLHLRDGRILAFRDPRRFGMLDVCKLGEETGTAHLSRLGPEPLADEFTSALLYHKSRNRKAAVKAWIMDQRVVVGVGNIYASESLFLAGIDPRRGAGHISRNRYERLHQAIQEVLKAAIAAGGSTLRDFRQAGGAAGYFQAQFNVYGRDGEPCPRCQAPIRSAFIAGRNSFWCGHCQR